MILIVVTLLGVLSVALVPDAKLRRIAMLRLDHLWVVWLAILIQIIVFGVFANSIPETAKSVLHLLTYAIALSFLWLNRHVPGALAIAVGAGLNLAAITANGGVMPASPGAWQRAGFDKIPELQNANSHVVDAPRLALFGDIFAIPESWPLSNVFSIGDVIIALAATYLAHRWCRMERTSNAWPAPTLAQAAARTDSPVGELIAERLTSDVVGDPTCRAATSTGETDTAASREEPVRSV